MHTCITHMHAHTAYVHTHTYTHTRTYTYIHTCIHTYMHTYLHTYIHTYRMKERKNKRKNEGSFYIRLLLLLHSHLPLSYLSVHMFCCLRRGTSRQAKFFGRCTCWLRRQEDRLSKHRERERQQRLWSLPPLAAKVTLRLPGTEHVTRKDNVIAASAKGLQTAGCAQ